MNSPERRAKIRIVGAPRFPLHYKYKVVDRCAPAMPNVHCVPKEGPIEAICGDVATINRAFNCSTTAKNAARSRAASGIASSR